MFLNVNYGIWLNYKYAPFITFFCLLLETMQDMLDT